MQIFKDNLFKYFLIFNIFYISFLIIEDRLIYVPSHAKQIEIYEKEWSEKFLDFIKSLWRTSVAVGFRAIFFWIWTFLKIGFIVFMLELFNIWEKEKIVLNGVIYSLFPILFLIFLKFLFLLFLKRDFNSSFSLFLNFDNNFLKFIFSSIEFFKFLEYFLLGSYLKEKVNMNLTKLIFILSPLFFLEKTIEFTYVIK